MKRYLGTIDIHGIRHVQCVAYPHAVKNPTEAIPHPLCERYDLHCYIPRHSEHPYAWGRLIPQSYQLALALLADASNDKGVALTFHQDYARNVVLRLKENSPWWINEAEIHAWLKTEQERRFLKGGMATLP